MSASPPLIKCAEKWSFLGSSCIYSNFKLFFWCGMSFLFFAFLCLIFLLIPASSVTAYTLRSGIFFAVAGFFFITPLACVLYTAGNYLAWTKDDELTIDITGQYHNVSEVSIVLEQSIKGNWNCS